MQDERMREELLKKSGSKQQGWAESKKSGQALLPMVVAVAVASSVQEVETTCTPIQNHTRRDSESGVEKLTESSLRGV